MPTEDEPPRRPLSGRRAQAARNDPVILDAARQVFMADPAAPVSAVAKAAGVGISALYKRFPSKEDMLARICRDGLSEYVTIADAAAQIEDSEEAFRTFMRGIVDADVHSLTVRLAGRFTPSEDFAPLVSDSGRLTQRLFTRAKDCGAIRPDAVVNDLVMIFEQLSAIHLGGTERTRALRRRYLALHLGALRSEPPPKLPGPGPTDEELGERWRRD
ncbi:MAG: TetR/AcrR family transcriptional regulator [Actinomycetia bacterium]|nr:TetR/AcrR family transcriptional regulator [Actinomycetes bacterium]